MKQVWIEGSEEFPYSRNGWRQNRMVVQAMVWMIEHAHTLAEGAGAASLAAAYRLRDELHDKRVGLVCSGGNTSLEHLKQALTSDQTTRAHGT